MTYSLKQQAATIVGAVELYEFDFGEGVVEYYTSGRKPLSYDWGDGLITYKPIPIKRSSRRASGDADSDTMSIGMPTQPTFVGLINKGALSFLQLRIIRGFGPLTPATESNYLRYWFIGNLSDLNVTRTKTQANLRTLEDLFSKTQVPRSTYQGPCNNDLYGPGCGLLQSNFSFTFDLREALENGTLLRVNVNPVTQNPSGTQSYGPADHVQLGDGEPDPPLDAGFGGIGFYTFGRVWLDSFPEAPRHILAHTYDPGDGANQCRLKLLAPLPTVDENKDYEAASNNLVLDSEDFNTNSWTLLNNCRAYPHTVPGPFFATKAATLTGIGTATPSIKQVVDQAGFINGSTYTLAVWLKQDDALETDVILISADSPFDIFRAKINWAGAEQPFVEVSSALNDYAVLTPQLQKVGDQGWYVFYVTFDWFSDDGDITVQIIPDSDTGGAWDKGIFLYGVMVKNGADLTDYEPNQKIWLTASFGCQKSGYACSAAKFNNLDNLFSFSQQPSIHPVLAGFRSP